MADPNFAACMEMIAFAAKILDEHETYTSAASTGLLVTTENLRNDLEGDWAQRLRDRVDSIRAEAAGTISKSAARALFIPLLRQTAVAIGFAGAAGPIDAIWEAIYDYMIDNSQTINDPEDTIDTTFSAGGGNVGGATVYVLTTGPAGEALGHLTDDAWTLTCTADARTLGKPQIEEWELEGTTARNDNLDYTGTGLVEDLRTLSADLSSSYVKNPSFNNYDLDGSSNLTGLDGWTQSGATLATNLAINLTYTARTTPGDTVAASLQFDADETIVQDVVAVKGAQLDPDVPYMISVAIAKVGTPTGTFTLRLSGTTGSGGVSTTLAHGAMTGSGTFDRLQLTGNSAWPVAWNANDLKLQIALSSGASIDASNYFLVDDIVFTPLSRVGDFGDPRTGRGSMGRWIGVTGGKIPSVKGDVYTAADTLNGTRAVNHWALTKIAQLGALPMTTGGTETIADK